MSMEQIQYLFLRCKGRTTQSSRYGTCGQERIVLIFSGEWEPISNRLISAKLAKKLDSFSVCSNKCQQ